MEVVIIMAIIGCIVFFFKRTFGGFVYAVAMVDLFLRILDFVKSQILGGEVLEFINKWCPQSVPAMINKYTDGALCTVLVWIYVAIMIAFEVYTIKAFLKKR